MPAKLFVDSLIEDHLITPEQLKNLGQLHYKELSFLFRQLSEVAIIREDILAQRLAAYLGYPYILLDSITINANAVNCIPYDYAEKNSFIPFDDAEGVLQIAFHNPCDAVLLQNIAAYTGKRIKIFVAAYTEICRFQQRYFSNVKAGGAVHEFESDTQKNTAKAGDDSLSVDSPAARLLNTVIERAIAGRASDIHVEPNQQGFLIRERINGDLRVMWMLKKEMQQEFIGRIKILCGVDTAETRLPQDGHFRMCISGQEIDFRVGIMPTAFGEKAAIRLLYQSAESRTIPHLGFTEEDASQIDSILQTPNGVIIICGPTGSGKTTTMAAFLQKMKNPAINIITIEDPIEQYIPHIMQIQVNPKIGNTFASLLRASLRQDPDIVMIGEIRDEETADIALRGAITGHLVLTTLHTNDALGSISRLFNLHVDSYIVADSLTAILYQRLMKEICTNCKTPASLSIEDAAFLGIAADSPVYEGRGCSFCDHTGYRDRFCVTEILQIDASLREMIQKKASKQTMLVHALANGFVPIRKKAVSHICTGRTSVREYKRVFGYV